MVKKIGFVAFGEVNTPYEKLQELSSEALATLQAQGYDVLDAGLVIDDVKYETADAAVAKLKGADMDCLVLCVAGWIPPTPSSASPIITATSPCCCGASPAGRRTAG